MDLDETREWLAALNVAFPESGGWSQPMVDIDFWLLWLGSLAQPFVGDGAVENLEKAAERIMELCRDLPRRN